MIDSGVLFTPKSDGCMGGDTTHWPHPLSLASDDVTAAKLQQNCDDEASFIQEFSLLTADFINCLLFSYFEL